MGDSWESAMVGDSMLLLQGQVLTPGWGAKISKTTFQKLNTPQKKDMKKETLGKNPKAP